MSLVIRAARRLRDEGLAATVRRSGRYVARKVRPSIEDPLFKHRRMLGDQLYERFAGVVQEGPLKGFHLAEQPKWCAADRGTMILGMYEARVLQKLVEFGGSNHSLIDIGAADGYFGIGCVFAGLYSRSICFELDSDMREILRRGAARNEVSSKVTIFGPANPSSLIQGIEGANLDLSRCTVLCDIEGAEFDLLDENILQYFRESKFIVELHESNVQNGEDKLTRLIERAERIFQVSLFDGGARNPLDCPILRDFRDNDRWLICSEGRDVYQRWMVLEPRAVPS